MQKPQRTLNQPHYYPKPLVQSREQFKVNNPSESESKSDVKKSKNIKPKTEEISEKSDNNEVENIDVKK